MNIFVQGVSPAVAFVSIAVAELLPKEFSNECCAFGLVDGMFVPQVGVWPLPAKQEKLAQAACVVECAREVFDPVRAKVAEHHVEATFLTAVPLTAPPRADEVVCLSYSVELVHGSMGMAQLSHQLLDQLRMAGLGKSVTVFAWRSEHTRASVILVVRQSEAWDAFSGYLLWLKKTLQAVQEGSFKVEREVLMPAPEAPPNAENDAAGVSAVAA